MLIFIIEMLTFVAHINNSRLLIRCVFVIDYFSAWAQM